MIKRVFNFLDRHRLILVALILLIISVLFIVINFYLFFNHNFIPLECTNNMSNSYCYHNDLKIFNDKNKIREEYENYKDKIEILKNNYKLPKLDIYTIYYYKVASDIDYNINGNNEELKEYFLILTNTYLLEDFYKEYNLYYDLYYHYKF